jgi:hypothetical protein
MLWVLRGNGLKDDFSGSAATKSNRVGGSGSGGVKLVTEVLAIEAKEARAAGAQLARG